MFENLVSSPMFSALSWELFSISTPFWEDVDRDMYESLLITISFWEDTWWSWMVRLTLSNLVLLDFLIIPQFPHQSYSPVHSPQVEIWWFLQQIVFWETTEVVLDLDFEIFFGFAAWVGGMGTFTPSIAVVEGNEDWDWSWVERYTWITCGYLKFSAFMKVDPY